MVFARRREREKKEKKKRKMMGGGLQSPDPSAVVHLSLDYLVKMRRRTVKRGEGKREGKRKKRKGGRRKVRRSMVSIQLEVLIIP